MKKKISKNMKKIFGSYKTIIAISFILNVILLLVTYYTISNNRIYSFSGKDNYIEINDGLIAMNTDINVLNGNSIKYINNEDYEVSEVKIGYYVMKNNSLIDIVKTEYAGDETINLSEFVNNFTSFNVVEKNTQKIHFTRKIKENIGNNLYLVIEAKTVNGDSIVDKLKLNITKISKY